jgi:hypothetical protein
MRRARPARVAPRGGRGPAARSSRPRASSGPCVPTRPAQPPPRPWCCSRIPRAAGGARRGRAGAGLVPGRGAGARARRRPAPRAALAAASKASLPRSRSGRPRRRRRRAARASSLSQPRDSSAPTRRSPTWPPGTKQYYVETENEFSLCLQYLLHKRGHDLDGHSVGPKVYPDQRGVAHQRPATIRFPCCQLPQPTASTVPARMQAPANQGARQGAVRLPPCDRLTASSQPGQVVEATIIHHLNTYMSSTASKS